VFKADNDSTPGIPGGNPPLSPLPGAAALDEVIERHLAEFDAIPPGCAASVDNCRARAEVDARGRAAGAGLRASGRATATDNPVILEPVYPLDVRNFVRP
jgi:hypothetical protein